MLAAGLSVIPLALLSVQSLQPEAKIAAKLAPNQSQGTWQLLSAHFAKRDRWFRVSVTDAGMLHEYGFSLPY